MRNLNKHKEKEEISLTYKMTPELNSRILPTSIWFSRGRNARRLSKAPHQTIHIQHQQVLQIRLLGLPMQ